MAQDSQFQLEIICNRFRKRLLLLLLRAGCARLLVLAVCLFAVMATLDWRMHFDSMIRSCLLIAFLVAVCLGAWSMLIIPLKHKLSNRRVLAYLDNVLPESQGQLLDHYELATAGEDIPELQSDAGRTLAAQSAAEIDKLTKSISLSQSLQKEPANRWMMSAGMCLVLLLIIGNISPAHLRIGVERFFNPFSTTRWPHRTTILVAEPENGWTVPQLESFNVDAEVTGDIPSHVTLAYRSEENGYWIRERLPVTEEEDFAKISYRFPEVREPIEFYLEGGDYRSDPHKIAVIRRPYLKKIAVHYRFPTYAGVPNVTRETGQVSGLEGTEVALEMECSLPLEKAVLVFDFDNEETESERVMLEPISETRLEHSFLLQSNGRYRVELFDKNGYREAKPEAYEIRVTPDEPPEVELLSPGRDLVETRRAAFDVAFRAKDKLGLREVQFLYRLGDDPQEHQLTNRITGPIPQTGTESQSRFKWPLRRLGDQLPEQGQLSFFVRVKDNNPTGRGVVESKSAQVKLVKPSEFHLDAIERAKRLEEEARIAWRNQLHAWQHGGRWLQEGSGAVDDELWTKMQTAQEKSFQATRQIRYHLEILTEKYQRNDMSRDFMAGRLRVITQLLARLTDEEHAQIAKRLDEARPKTAAEAEGDRLKAARTSILTGTQDNQKMAVLVLERLVRKLYDWRDLQNCTITTKLLYEQQEEVGELTASLAPKTIAKEIEDLADADQEKLLTLGKQQRAIFDTETGLENQLTYLTYKAEKQGRQTILVPLRAAWANLRNQRVNDYLKRAAQMIDNNQPSQILEDQIAAIRALRLVEDGLIIAGQKVDPDEPLSLDMMPSKESQFDPDLIQPDQIAESQPPENATETTPLEHGNELAALPEGTDPLSASIRRMIELQDNVLARTRYLSKNSTDAEMPRFIKLKLLRLEQRQDLAVVESQKAISLANTQKNQPVEGLLKVVGDEFAQMQQYLKNKEIESTSHQIQADSISTLQELLQYLAMEKTVADAIEENKRLGGVDAFGRKYLLRSQDLDVVVGVLSDLNHARQWLSDSLRKLDRFQSQPAQSPFVIQQESLARMQASKGVSQAVSLLKSAIARAGSLSDEVKPALRKAGLENIDPDLLSTTAKPIANSTLTETKLKSLKESNQELIRQIQSLRNLLEERVKPPVVLAATQKPNSITPEEFAKLTSRKTLAERLKNEPNLSPELREMMLRSLENEFPAKYRDLLRAYYASFIQPSEEKRSEELP